MLKTLLISMLLVGTLSGAAHASDTVDLTDESKARIRQTLTEQGYEVGKTKIEDGLYEAYARKDGAKLEVFLNAAFEVVRTERDD
ncbi:Peptidase propeptide and YPEB domain-containing protein [Roseivivax lentus]|uniref:Peptidase propeptide and YPEB domain-containing protein n=1 Tax=Roseivivax lentus TaxID=633194 RepID=A0A1N7LV19_9RHOB|nr:PepSY domain-containing protein [Roseivivax lentus]SIS77676.1 Peptidase propeptide and YPEB domain-containing protein [Roseivivax lentus]